MLIPYGFFACALMEIWDFTIITYIVLYKAIEYLIILPAFTFIYSHSYRDEKKYDICDTKYLEEESRRENDFMHIWLTFPVLTSIAIFCAAKEAKQVSSDNLYFIYIIPAMYIVRLIGQAICIMICRKL